ncbi:MAG: Ig-like domain-containing protein [Candidatus Peribacteraceae bacterium]|nr:Ig-like domain-containing protein [Candidatus Peribacteraceae bacterium]
MSRENIRIADPNFTTDGTYYYCLLKDAQVLQVKADDGTVAFSYPVDTQILSTITSLSYDGVHFWSQETKSGGGGIIIRKWAIDSYILKQVTSFAFNDGGVHLYSSNDMAIEHYILSVGDNSNGGGGYTTNMHEINISDTSMLSPGDILTFVKGRTPTQSRSSTSYVETVTVQSVVDSDTVILTNQATGGMQGDPHSDGLGFRGPGASYNASTEPVPPDLVYVTKYIWMLNDKAPSNPSTAALYKINAVNGSNIVQYSGSQYLNIKGACFFTEYNTSGAYPWEYNTTIDGDKRYLLFVNSSSLLFFNISSLTMEKSLNLGNVKDDGIAIWDVYDLAVSGFGDTVSLYRLQAGTTYGDPLADENWSSSYSYEKTILARIVNSIAVTAEPTILPADGSSTASIAAIVRDQYNNPVGSKLVNWADDVGGRLSPTSSTTDVFGRAYTTYLAGSTEDDVKITATVENGLIT